MRALEYVIYADRFGWTPEQVDALPVDVEPWLIPIHNLIEGMRHDAQQRAGSGG